MRLLHYKSFTYFEDDDYLSFVIESEKGYYFSIYDKDEDYETEKEEYIKQCLTPKMEPIIIYDNKFNTTYETKYNFVEDLLKDCGKHFSDVTKIIKVEVRYERK